MKKRFTLFLSSLLVCIGVAKADFVQSYDSSAEFWTAWESTNPDGLQAVITEHGCDGTVKFGTNDVVVTAEGDITVTVQYSGGNHRIYILGVELLDAEGKVAYSDYHVGNSGGSSDKNVYTLSGVAAGNYTARYFVCSKAGDHDLTATNGTITLTGAVDEQIDLAVVKSAANAELDALAVLPAFASKAEEFTAAKTAIDGVTLGADDLSGKLAEAEINEIIAGVVENVALTFQTTATDDHRNGVHVSVNNSTNKAIGAHSLDYKAYWFLKVASVGTYYLHSVFGDVYMGKPSENCPLTDTPNVAYAFEYIDAANGIVEFKASGETLHASNHDDDKLLNWDGNEDASRWVVAAVDITGVDITKDITDLLEANADNHAENPVIGQYSTAAYNALLEAKSAATTLKQVDAAILAFETSKNLPLFTIDGVISYAAEKSIYENEQGGLYFKATDTEDQSMLWAFDMTAIEVGVTDKVVVRNAATGNLFWSAPSIKVTETDPAVEDDGIFLFYTEGNGTPIHAQNDGQKVVRWGSYDANSGSAWKFTFVGVSNPAAYDLSEVAASFNEQATAFAALESNEALTSLAAVQAKWTEGKSVVDALSAAIAADELVLKADVVAAMEMMTDIQAVVTYYTETFVAKKEAANTAMAELDEASEQYATLTEAIDVATVTTVAELEAKVAAIDTVLDYIANLPDEEPGDESALAPSEVGNGTFYLYNVGADMFLCSGNHWGSRASVTGGGVPMTLAGEGNVYSISAGALFKDGFLGTDGGGNPFMDCSSQNWTFELVSENVYKIVKDGSYLFWNGEGTTYLNCGADPNTEASQWMLYTEEARIAYLANATAADPIDATFLIKNAYFAKGNGRIVAKGVDLTNSPSWKGTTLTDLWGTDSDDPAVACYAVEQYGKQFDNYQELTNVPNGVYYMTAKGFYRGTVVPYIYANDEKCALIPLVDGDANNIATGAKALTSDKYLLEGVKVTVEDGTLRVGIKSDEKIDWCVFDDFQLTYYGAPEWATDEQKQALSEAIAEAEGHILGFAAGEYAPYTNVEALKTLAAAKAVDADNALAGEITAVLETLAAAVWTENAEEMNAIYDGSFEYAYSTNGNVQPIAWHGINNHDNATDIRYMWDASANAGLTATSTDKALFTKYNAFYGTEAGYTMPLKENTEYELTFIYGGWSDCQKDGYVTITGPEDAVIELSTDRLPLDAVDGHQNAESWKTYTATFTTGAAGNYVLGLRKDREVEGKQSQYVYGDFKLYAVAKAEPQYLTVVGANVGDVAIEEGAATVSSISTIDVIFDRPVAKAENAGWATLADKWDNNTLQVKVLEAEEGSSEYVVRFSIWDWMDEFTEAGDYILTIPEGLIVGANGTNYINETITATITIEASASTSLTVTNVTVGEDVMEGFTVVATPADMIKVNFDGEFYFQGTPTIVDAENKDASEYFQFMNGRDLDGSNSYIFMAQNWQETAAPAGVYTITLPKASFMEMMQCKAPAEDIVLTVQIIVDEEPVEVTEIKIATDKGDSYAELMEKGATLQLVATVTPENATTAITWSSDNELVTVDENGLVTLTDYCPEIAWVTITATAANGVTGTFGMNVYAPVPGTVTGITLNATWKDLEVKSGDTFQLVATVEPADATDKTVTWTSNADFATVDANGLVTFTGTPEDGGTVTITATASNGMTATCMLSVTFVADDTAIDNLNTDAETVIYDIHGRRVTEMTKGVYIVNGKKVIKK